MLSNRMTLEQAEYLLEHFPPHRWYKKSLYWVLQQELNVKNIPNNPLNERLLESLKTGGFISPFLCMDSWYPICGSQRLRAGLEMSEEMQKTIILDICKLDTSVWLPLYFWSDKDQGHQASQIFIQMLEKVFKTLYMKPADHKGVSMLLFEEEGDNLHWEHRDGPKVSDNQ